MSADDDDWQDEPYKDRICVMTDEQMAAWLKAVNAWSEKLMASTLERKAKGLIPGVPPDQN